MTNVLFILSSADPQTLAEPHRLFSDAGWDITIATPNATPPTLDLGFAGKPKRTRDQNRAYLATISEALAHPAALEDCNEEEFNLVFYPGGPGRAEDLAFDKVFGALLTRRIEAGRPTALLAAKHGVVPLRPQVLVDRNVYTGRNPASAGALAHRLITDLSRKTPPVKIFEPLPLQHGAPLPSRIAKAAMEEDLGGQEHLPNERVFRLYQTWSQGGVGLIITGNVMVDPRALTNPAAMILDRHAPLEPFRQWAAAARSGGAQVWMQISHPGRQIARGMPGIKIAPSAVPMNMGAHSKRFEIPREMTRAEIEDVIERFVTTATRAAEAGFDGVQIHAAHGYLVSQFLSPLTNLRTDEWGGDLQGRSKVLREVVARIRAAVPADFAVGVKLNSADFQRGGFDVADAAADVQMLGTLGVDLVEVSGGSYESPAMQGQTRDQRTLDREAYFLRFAKEINEVAPMPLMVTGGITRRHTAERVLEAGIDVVGIGTALSVMPDLPNRWRIAEAMAPQMPEPRFKDKAINSLAKLVQVKYNLHRIADGKRPQPRISAVRALLIDQVHEQRNLRQYRRWLETRMH